MEFEAILDKIVGITEANQQLQGKFIESIDSLRSLLEKEGLTHEEIKKTLFEIDHNIDDIYTMKKKVSNTEIITLLYAFKDDKNNFLYMLKNYVEKFDQVDEKVSKMLRIENKIDEFQMEFKYLKEKVITANNLQKAIVIIITTLTIMVAGIQLLKTMNDGIRNDKIDVLIQQMEEGKK